MGPACSAARRARRLRLAGSVSVPPGSVSALAGAVSAACFLVKRDTVNLLWILFSKTHFPRSTASTVTG